MPGLGLLQAIRKLLWFCLLREIFFLGFVVLQGVGTSRVKGGKVIIESLDAPSYVKVGESVQLKCNWRERHTRFYKVNWYKDGNKFYSYTFDEGGNVHKQSKTTGFKVILSESNNRIVTLSSLSIFAGGLYQCETMGEAPQFNTDTALFNLTVVRLPEIPRLEGLKGTYYLPDEFNISCIAEHGMPPPEIEFEVNNNIITSESTRVYSRLPLYDSGSGLYTSESRLAFPLGEHHQPQFHLVCRAKVGKFEVKYETDVTVEGKPLSYFFSVGLVALVDSVLFWGTIFVSTLVW